MDRRSALFFLTLMLVLPFLATTNQARNTPEAEALPARLMGVVFSKWAILTKPLVDQIANNHGNTMRLQLAYGEWMNNIVSWYNGEYYQPKMASIRQWCSDDGLIFWLDCLGPSWGEADWTQMQANAILDNGGAKSAWIGAYSAMISALHPQIVGLMNEPSESLPSYGVSYSQYKQFCIDSMNAYKAIDSNLVFAACSFPFWDMSVVATSPIVGVTYYQFHYYYAYDGNYPSVYEPAQREYWDAANPTQLAAAKIELYTQLDSSLSSMYSKGLNVVWDEFGTGNTNPNYLDWEQDCFDYAQARGLGVMHAEYAAWDLTLGYYSSGLLNSNDPGNIYATWGGLNDLGNVWAINMPQTNYVSVVVHSATGGSVTPVAATYSWQIGSTHVLTATPSDGYTFSHWSGLYSGTNNPYSLVVTTGGSITPVFSTVAITLVSTSGGATNPNTGSYNWASGSSHTITAIPALGYNFTGWTGGYTGMNNPYSLTVSTPVTLTAHFSLLNSTNYPYNYNPPAAPGPISTAFSYPDTTSAIVTGSNFQIYSPYNYSIAFQDTESIVSVNVISGRLSSSTNDLKIYVRSGKLVFTNLESCLLTITSSKNDTKISFGPGIYVKNYGGGVLTCTVGAQYTVSWGDTASITQPSGTSGAIFNLIGTLFPIIIGVGLAGLVIVAVSLGRRRE